MQTQRGIVRLYADDRSTRERVGPGEALAASVCVHAELAQQLQGSPNHHVTHRQGPSAVERATAELDKSYADPTHPRRQRG